MKCRHIRSGRILILSLSVYFLVALDFVAAPTPSPVETFDAAQSFNGRRGLDRGRHAGGDARGPRAERLMKYREAGELLVQLDDGLRKLELLTRDDIPGMVARRWEIATGILRDMSENTEKFVEALWLESIDVEEFLASADPLNPVAPQIGVTTLRGSIDQLRSMWRAWRDDRDVVGGSRSPGDGRYAAWHVHPRFARVLGHAGEHRTQRSGPSGRSSRCRHGNCSQENCRFR